MWHTSMSKLFSTPETVDAEMFRRMLQRLHRTAHRLFCAVFNRDRSITVFTRDPSRGRAIVILIDDCLDIAPKCT